MIVGSIPFVGVVEDVFEGGGLWPPWQFESAQLQGRRGLVEAPLETLRTLALLVHLRTDVEG